MLDLCLYLCGYNRCLTLEGNTSKAFFVCHLVNLLDFFSYHLRLASFWNNDLIIPICGTHEQM